MKIFSKFTDYYDSALGSFLDSDVEYNRTPKVLTFHPIDFPSLGEDFDGKLSSPNAFVKKTGFCKDAYRPNLFSFWVGFCGKYYPFVTSVETISCMVESEYSKDAIADPMSYADIKGMFADNGDWSKYVFPTDFDTVCEYSRFDADYDEMLGIKSKKLRLPHDYKNPETVEFWKDKAFEQFGPIFLAVFPCMPKYIKDYDLKRIWIFKNPRLKTINFQKVMDPYTALWTIENWLDTHARPDEAVVPVGDDITRLQAYGFDKKTSFRKAKET